MKRLSTTLFLLGLVSLIQAQPCSNNQNRYSDQPIFDENEIKKEFNIPYGNAEDSQGNMVELQFDVYSPKQIGINPPDKLNRRPLVVVVHGSGFTQPGSKDNAEGLCKLYARRGFVAVAINYRLDREFTGDRCTRPEKEIGDAIYRAIQDLRASLRYLVENADDYGINTDWIFLSGFAAGGTTVLNTAYASQEEINAVDPTVETRLGGIDNSGNDLTNTFVIRGIHNDWGSINDIAYIEAGEGIPSIFFHGLADEISPPDCGFPLGCTNYKKKCGSIEIARVLEEQDVCTELNLKKGAGHGFYDDKEGKEYRVARASCFFRSVMECFNSACQSVVYRKKVPIDCSPNSTARLSEDEEVATILFPNPATTTINLNSELSAGELEVRIFDLVGREILAIRNALTIDISELAPGMYIVRINHNGELISKPLVKE